MANEKLITLDNLRRFKQQLDEHGGGGGGGSGDAPRVFELSYDFNEIPSEIISQLRVGDVVKSNAVVIGTVTYNDGVDVTIVSIDNSCVTYYYYTYASEDGEWVYSNMASYDLSEMGSKHYQHTVYIEDIQNQESFAFSIMSTSASPMNTMTDITNYLQDKIGSNKMHGVFGIDNSTSYLYTSMMVTVDPDNNPTLNFSGVNTQSKDVDIRGVIIEDVVIEVS